MWATTLEANGVMRAIAITDEVNYDRFYALT